MPRVAAKPVVEQVVVEQPAVEPRARIVFIQQPGYEYVRMFQARGWTVTNAIDRASVIQFTGGEDVSPARYGETPHPSVWWNTERDNREFALFEKYLGQKDFLGICRGGQFLTVANGDRLWQNVDKHGVRDTHPLRVTEDNRQVQVSSTHHQMFRLRPGSKAEILAYAQRSEQKEAEGVVLHGLDPENDLEALWYAESRSLCYQPHPEFFDRSHPCQELYFEFIEKKLGYPR